ncbi:MAG: hypothetical protein ABI429_06560 [Jatrophihabitantaceae bacterium]
MSRRVVGPGGLLLTGTVLLAATVLLAGCGTGSGSSRLQDDVAAVTQAAAGNDHAATRTALTRLTQDLTAARSAGTVTTQRYDQINAAIRAVSTDLGPTTVAPTTAAKSTAAAHTSTPPSSATARPTATPKPTPSPIVSPTKTHGHGHDKGGGNGNG